MSASETKGFKLHCNVYVPLRPNVLLLTVPATFWVPVVPGSALKPGLYLAIRTGPHFPNRPLPALLLTLTFLRVPTSWYVPKLSRDTFPLRLLYSVCWPPNCPTDPHTGRSHLHVDFRPESCDSEVYARYFGSFKHTKMALNSTESSTSTRPDPTARNSVVWYLNHPSSCVKHPCGQIKERHVYKI
jgi:hypothetical protein